MRTVLVSLGVFLTLAPQATATDPTYWQVRRLQTSIQQLQVRAWNDEQRIHSLEGLRACIGGSLDAGQGVVLTYQHGCLGIANVP
jgi:hypothetical protein